MKILLLPILISSLTWSAGSLAASAESKETAKPVPYATLNPPADVTPAMTRFPYPWGRGGALPKQTWTEEERATYEANIKWFHDAKYGVFHHFLAYSKHRRAGNTGKNWRPKGNEWTSEEWNQVVDAVDVEAIADQAADIGAGYVIITLLQNHKYGCAPNPVMDELWGLKPGQFNSKRDLPMDLGKALAKRGIPLMLYIAADNTNMLPTPASFKGTDRHENWLKVAQWYSDHYGKLAKGWWVDGLGKDYTTNYRVRFHQVLKHGNPDALVTSGQHELSEFLHGHCSQSDWNKQQRIAKPFFGRWDQDFNIQWHSLLFLGRYWGDPLTPRKTEDVVKYASDIVKGGGVITFDVGAFKTVDGKTIPTLEIPEAQMVQLRAVRDALKDIPASDGAGQ